MDAILEFNVSNQIITRVDNFDVVGDSLNYLYAHFNFLTDDWTGTPTAIFQNDGKAYNAILDQTNTCLVPHEVLGTDDRYVLVSVFCGNRVTANTAKVFVIESGWTDDMEASDPPTPSVYTQIIDRMDGIESAVQDATERTEAAAQRTEDAADKAEVAISHYPRVIDKYWYVWDVETEDFVNTGIRAEAEDGTSATVEVQPNPTGHTVIITDASGTHSFDVPDGYDGRGIVSVAKTGTDGDVDIYTMTFTSGEPFTYYVSNGNSATISTQPISNGHRLIITDKNGTRTVDVMNGTKGDAGNGIYSVVKSAEYQNIDYYTITYTNGTKTTFPVTNGVSITVTVEEVTGGHNVTLTDVNGSQTFCVRDGNAGTLPIYICSASEYDPVTRIPTVQDPVADAFYLVPEEDPTTSNMFVEWIYKNDAWEMFGSANVDLSDYATKTELSDKVDKVDGKGLSTNDYTTEEKTKLDGIAIGAEVNVQSDWNQTNTVADDFIKNKPTIPPAVTVDSAMSSSSTNPVQNKVIATALDEKLDAPQTAGTNGQVLTSDGQGGQEWRTPSSDVTDVEVDGVSVVTNGVAEIDLTSYAKSADVPTTAADVGAVPTTRTVNGKALSSDILLNASDVGAGTYSKPLDGIPKTDFSSAVQTSLDKADTALQSLVILSYGNSVWADFEAAYNAKAIVYCRASSNSNPASGSQTRMAFMAYVNNETTPTEVEFQYYRSVSSHSATQQGDQVYVYKLTKTGGWTVTTRESYTKIVAGTNMGSSYSNGALTLNFTGTIPSSASEVGAIAAPSSPVSGAFLVYNGSAWVAQTLETWQGGNY